MTKLNKATIISIIFVLFSIDLILLYVLFQKIRSDYDLRIKFEKIEDSYNLNIAFIEKMKYFAYLQLKSNDFKLPERMKSSINAQAITFENVSDWRLKIVLRFTELNCSTCIDEDIELLNKYVNEIGQSNLIIFSTFKNLRSLLSFKENHKLKIQIFNIEELKLPIEQANVPYFFWLDSTLTVSNVFIPQKEFPELSEIFFNKSIAVFK